MGYDTATLLTPAIDLQQILVDSLTNKTSREAKQNAQILRLSQDPCLTLDWPQTAPLRRTPLSALYSDKAD